MRFLLTVRTIDSLTWHWQTFFLLKCSLKCYFYWKIFCVQLNFYCPNFFFAFFEGNFLIFSTFICFSNFFAHLLRVGTFLGVVTSFALNNEVFLLEMATNRNLSFSLSFSRNSFNKLRFAFHIFYKAFSCYKSNDKTYPLWTLRYGVITFQQIFWETHPLRTLLVSLFRIPHLTNIFFNRVLP